MRTQVGRSVRVLRQFDGGRPWSKEAQSAMSGRVDADEQCMVEPTTAERSRAIELGSPAGLLVGGLSAVLTDERVQQADDLLLEVGEVFAHRVEAGVRGLAEVPDLRADLATSRSAPPASTRAAAASSARGGDTRGQHLDPRPPGQPPKAPGRRARPWSRAYRCRGRAAGSSALAEPSSLP